MRVAHGFMTALFLFSVAVQYNDADPLRWMAIYGGAAVASANAAAGRRSSILAAATGLIALPWALSLAPSLARTSLGAVFGHIGMVDEPAEEARESLGLLIVAAWMAVIAIRGAAARWRVRR